MSTTNELVKIGNKLISIRNIPKTKSYGVTKNNNFVTTHWAFIDGLFFHSKIQNMSSDVRLQFNLGDKLEFEWEAINKMVDEKVELLTEEKKKKKSKDSESKKEEPKKKEEESKKKKKNQETEEEEPKKKKKKE